MPTNIPVKVYEIFLKGTLRDLLDSEMENIHSITSVEEHLMGKGSKGFQIKAPDTESTITFNNTHMLTRFTSMPMTHQRAVLTAIRSHMKVTGATGFQLKVKWTETVHRTISITQKENDVLEFVAGDTNDD